MAMLSETVCSMAWFSGNNALGLISVRLAHAVGPATPSIWSTTGLSDPVAADDE